MDSPERQAERERVRIAYDREQRTLLLLEAAFRAIRSRFSEEKRRELARVENATREHGMLQDLRDSVWELKECLR